jgi:Domain of unknown function (DUF4381)
MQAPQQQLDLKDIHLPETVSWWPPAVGYWIVLSCTVICIMTYLSIKAYRKRHAIKRSALHEFNLIKKSYASNSNKKQLVTSLSELLRRAAISTYPLSDCAGLTGKQWLSWLDKQLSKSTLNFSDGPGYLLTDFIYSSSQQANDIDDLMSLTLQWLKQLPPPADKAL